MEYIKYCVFVSLFITIISLFIFILAVFARHKAKSKLFMYLMLILTIFCVICSGYFSLDLIYKDYVTEIGVCMYSHRESFYHTYYFDIGEDKYKGYDVYTDKQLNGEIPEKGELYEYIYAKRTRVLLDIEKIS